MRVTIQIPRFLQQEIQSEGAVEVAGYSVEGCLTELASKHPELSPVLFSSDGKLLLKWMVYVNDRLIPSTSALSQSVQDGDVIGLFPVVAGG